MKFFSSSLSCNSASARTPGLSATRSATNWALRRHVFKFECRRIAATREAGQRRLVVIRRQGVGEGDIEGGRICFIAIDMGLQAKPGRGQRQHPAQLAAAQNTDGSPGRDRSA